MLIHTSIAFIWNLVLVCDILFDMKKYLYPIIGLLFVAGVVFVIVSPGKGAGPSIYDDFAKCIKASGTTFYGAFWCPHCAAQKARFGTSAQYLPYVECSNPDGKTQTQICINANIDTYPTWQFPAGLNNSSTTSRHVGEMELVDLAAATSCQLPTTTSQ